MAAAKQDREKVKKTKGHSRRVDAHSGGFGWFVSFASFCSSVLRDCKKKKNEMKVH